jgi:hypothetical protein
MRVNALTAGLLAAALACAGAGLVTAQEAAPPEVPTPPEESTPEPSPPVGPPSTVPSSAGETEPPRGVPDPAPYTVLGPNSRRAEAPPPPPAPEPLEEVLPEVVEPLPVEPGPPPPLPRRPRHPGAIVQALDKVTAETLRFEVPAGRPIRWKSLVFRTNACETEAVNEPLKEATAHLIVTSEPRAQPGRAAPDPAQVFRGWMFASSPGLNPFEHPVYDVWLVGCRVPMPVVSPPAVPGAPEAAGARPVETPGREPAPTT